MKRGMTVLVMSLAVAGTAQAQSLDPIGGQFQANSYTTSKQQGPSVATCKAKDRSQAPRLRLRLIVCNAQLHLSDSPDAPLACSATLTHYLRGPI
jgi:hypothetical protein